MSRNRDQLPKQASVQKASVQSFLPGFQPFQEALTQLSEASSEERGAVFTRREVVEFILDLSGYTSDVPLHQKQLLEPSFGSGEFLLAAVERLLTAYQAHEPNPVHIVSDLEKAIRGVELHRKSFVETCQKLYQLLVRFGLSPDTAQALLESWCIQGDFLLEHFSFPFTHVIGNPPYVRQELIPDELLAEYRSRFQTIFDRADLYIPFIEKALLSLRPKGTLGIICSDRWMKNRYGGPLRKLVADNFFLKYYVDMVDTPAFHAEVTAYPAITVITKEKAGKTRLAQRPEIKKSVLTQLAAHLTTPSKRLNGSVTAIANITQDSDPWVLESFEQLAIVRRLESQFPTLEEAGCKVGIGVATGADAIFIRPFDELDIEDERKLPLIMTTDIQDGTIQWGQRAILNPFQENGALVDLRAYPKLAAYLEDHQAVLKQRHVAKRSPQNWYRTIDRISPALTTQPKLLIPDIKGVANIVYEEGKFYPHHNLYYIVSDTWDLKALQLVLLSGIAHLFVSLYSPKMRGGYLRFQAQHLRRIRIPLWEKIPDQLKDELLIASTSSLPIGRVDLASKLYGLTKQERAILSALDEHPPCSSFLPRHDGSLSF